MANIIRKWRRFLALGCTHGVFEDKALTQQVLAFKERWKPDLAVHLGDAIDLAALRGGAGDVDQAESPIRDLHAGLEFLSRFRPNVYMLGNHEHRLHALMASPRAVVADLAAHVMRQIEVHCREFKARILPYHGRDGVFRIADMVFLHGFMHGVNAVRDHAEAYTGGTVRKCVLAHLHRVQQASARHIDGGAGYCVGTLADISRMGYAATRRETLSWGGGFAFGEYTEGDSVIWLAKTQNDQKTFRLPPIG